MYVVTCTGWLCHAVKYIANLHITRQKRKTCDVIIIQPVQFSYLCPIELKQTMILRTTMAFALFIAAIAFTNTAGAQKADRNVYTRGGITQMNPELRKVALVFTAADMADGADTVISTLKQKGVKGHFFFTGRFFERFPDVVKRLVKAKHYVGCHGYSHLLYFPWDRNDTMLVSRAEFRADIRKAYDTMAPFGIKKKKAYFFIPPFEHFNDTVSAWAKEMGLQLINNTYGTLTYGDYTTPDMARYYSSDYILERTLRMAEEQPRGINGHILLIHFGTSEKRTDKFYNRLPELIDKLRGMGYEFADLSKVIPKPAK